MKDYYSLLNVSQDSSTSSIKQAAQAKLNQLKNAYAVLSDAEKRAAYDSAMLPERNNHYSLFGLPQNAQEAVIKQAAQQKINEIKQAFNILSDTHKRKAYDAELKAQLEVTQTDTGSFQIKPKAMGESPAPKADFENVLSASNHLPSHINPYDTPDADMQDAEDEEYELAGRLIRLGAVLLDSLMFLLPLILVTILVAVLFGADSLNSLENGDPLPNMDSMGALFIGIIVISYLALIILNLVWLHRYAQSIGKRLLGIKIARTDGSRCGLRRIIFLRSLPIQLLSMIPLLGMFVPLVDALFIFQQSRKCVHDMIADTVVVKA